jgi:ABC-type phosphate/phosphonate transport system substrate-binding protein
MTRRKMFGFALLCTAVGFALATPGASIAQPKDDVPLKLGMVKSFFNDLPDVVVKLVTEPFGDLMKATTGLEGALSTDADAFGTAALLNNNQVQFGVFHAHEFAWVQKKYPDLRPLMVATNPHDEVRVFVVVRQSNSAKSMADLRGKIIDLPAQTKQHCWVYLEKHCSDNAQNNPKAFFKQILKSDSPVEAINDVCSGKADAVVVDTITLEFYKSIKGPVFAKNLRILQQSEAFPPAVIAYKQGAVKDAMLKQFYDGLLTAHQNAGSDVMKLWNIKAFEPIPKDYTQSLANVLKEYPSPEVTKVSMK